MCFIIILLNRFNDDRQGGCTRPRRHARQLQFGQYEPLRPAANSQWPKSQVEYFRRSLRETVAEAAQRIDAEERDEHHYE